MRRNKLSYSFGHLVFLESRCVALRYFASNFENAHSRAGAQSQSMVLTGLRGAGRSYFPQKKKKKKFLTLHACVLNQRIYKLASVYILQN